jgi:hypothetical protein
MAADDGGLRGRPDGLRPESLVTRLTSYPDHGWNAALPGRMRLSDSALAEPGPTPPPRAADAAGGPSPRHGERAARFVWTAYWCVVAMLVVYVLAFQDAVPYYDDYSVAMGTLQGGEPTFGWLWAQHNEHRMPLGRLILYASFHHLGPDPRPPMVLAVVLLAAAAALLLGACRDLRGRYALQDVAVPLLLAGLGHYYNALWAFQLMLIGAAFLFAFALRCMVRATVNDGDGRPAASLLAGLAAVLLPTTGAQGLVLGVAVAIWCGWHAIQLVRRGGGASRFAGLLLAAAPIIVVGYSALYVHGLQRPTPSTSDVMTFIEASAGVATVGLGPATAADLPWGWIMLALAAVGSVALAWRILHGPGDRGPSLALLAGMIGGWGLIAVIAYGRGSGGIGAILVTRYVILGALGIAALYLVGVRLEARRLGYLLTLPILVATLWRQPASVAAARDHGLERLSRGRAFAADVAAGVRLQTLARRHRSYFTDQVSDTGEVAAWISALARERAGPFARPAPRLDTRPEPLREIEVGLAPLQVGQAAWQSGEGQTLGGDPQLVFALEAPVRMVGVRLEMTVNAPGSGGAWSQLYWGRREQNPVFSEERAIGFQVWEGAPPFTIWCEGTLDMLRLDPDSKVGTRFKIASIVVLAPLE